MNELQKRWIVVVVPVNPFYRLLILLIRKSKWSPDFLRYNE